MAGGIAEFTKTNAWLYRFFTLQNGGNNYFLLQATAYQEG
jgi:hypothetical protein